MKVEDSHGFHYEVDVTHSPSYGLSVAYYHGRIIASLTTDKLYQPSGDNDREWEEYEERFCEIMDAAESDLLPTCKQYFDYNKQFQ